MKLLNRLNSRFQIRKLQITDSQFPNPQFTPHNTAMLWIAGAVTLIIWFVAKFLLHKGPSVHIVLILAAAFFFIQLVQDRRTRAYHADRCPPLF